MEKLKNGKISRREKRKLNRVENDLNKKLDTALRNQERAGVAKKKGKYMVNKAKKGKRNQRQICRMPTRSERDNMSK